MAEAPRSRKRVLVAEDDPAIATLLKRVLSKDYDVTVANDGQSAIVLAAQTPPPQLLLLDVMMPGLDGIGVAQHVRTLPGMKSVPIIFLTAKGTPADVIRGIQHGARHYITKPFKIEDLLAKVKKAIGS